ncbi:MAG: hypothetical protein QOI86_2430, partial [Actinomycetota bacterium]|nr:hypothetical protein [Actinomycetota bacterium]
MAAADPPPAGGQAGGGAAAPVLEAVGLTKEFPLGGGSVLRRAT